MAVRGRHQAESCTIKLNAVDDCFLCPQQRETQREGERERERVRALLALLGIQYLLVYFMILFDMYLKKILHLLV